MRKLEKRASNSEAKPLFGREVLAESLAESRILKLEGHLKDALAAMGISATITDSEEKSLVTVFTIEIEGRQRQVALGNKIGESGDPVGEVRGILRMFGLEVFSK